MCQSLTWVCKYGFYKTSFKINNRCQLISLQFFYENNKALHGSNLWNNITKVYLHQGPHLFNQCFSLTNTMLLTRYSHKLHYGCTPGVVYTELLRISHQFSVVIPKMDGCESKMKFSYGHESINTSHLNIICIPWCHRKQKEN